MMSMTLEGPRPATAAEPAAATEFGGLDLVDHVQVHPLLRYDKQWNEQKKHNNEDGFSRHRRSC